MCEVGEGRKEKKGVVVVHDTPLISIFKRDRQRKAYQ